MTYTASCNFGEQQADNVYVAVENMQGVTWATGGDGHWSTRVADVKIDSIHVNSEYYDDEGDEVDNVEQALLHGARCSVNVYFDRTTWNDADEDSGILLNRNVGGDGLIYTDDTWLENCIDWLIAQGMTAAEANELDYTEQGMQDEGMVSLEAGGGFLCGFVRTFAH